MKPTIQPSDVLRDPDFHALPEIERLKVLYHIDPDYRRLHPRERWKVVNMIPKPFKPVDNPKPKVPAVPVP